jgi:hypothetical protein
MKMALRQQNTPTDAGIIISSNPVCENASDSIRDNSEPDSMFTNVSDRQHSTDAGIVIRNNAVALNEFFSMSDNFEFGSNITEKK